MQLIGLVVLFSLTLIATNSKTPFAGVWMLDKTKSEFNGCDTPEHILIQVEQDQDRLRVIEIGRSNYGKSILQSDYILEGRNQRIHGTLVVRSGVQRERWTLSEGGSRLRIERSIGGCESSVRLIFKRATGVVGTR